MLIRFFDVAVIGAQHHWAPALAAIATITIIVGNVGALSQTNVKRILGYSSVGQAGYMLAGVVVGTRLGVQATVLYLCFYLMMNMGAFAVIVANQNARADGDDLSGLAGLGARNPWLAWPLTISMLALAGIPGTVGFIGKFQLIHALVDGGYTWLAIVLVVGSMISLGYYLRVIAAVWMRAETPSPGAGFAARFAFGSGLGAGRLAPIAGGSGEADSLGAGSLPPIAGGSPDADPPGADPSEADPPDAGPADAPAPGTGAGAAEHAAARATSPGYPEVTLVAVVFSAATIVFGVFPQPMFTFVAHAGRSLGLF